jgi:hypothetical protein
MRPGGIQTHDLSRRAAVDLHLSPRGHWDRQLYCTTVLLYCKQNGISSTKINIHLFGTSPNCVFWLSLIYDMLFVPLNALKMLNVSKYVWKTLPKENWVQEKIGPYLSLRYFFHNSDHNFCITLCFLDKWRLKNKKTLILPLLLYGFKN